MRHLKAKLLGAAAVALAIGAPRVALAADQTRPATSPGAQPDPASGGTNVGEIIVTAQKREENIQNVGLSITAASGETLTKLGITDPSQLQKVVPGFYATPTYYGTEVFTIRGVGYQDTALASSPTVSIYLDEAPLPYASLTNGVSLDVQRVEVLKGPQGTLFGENATGGAVNYIANKPTDTFQAGADVDYGRFNTVNLRGFVGGQILPGLDARLAVQTIQSGAWQKGYGPQTGQSIGGQDFLNGRLSVLWKPNENLRALLTLSGWQDNGYNQVPQLFGFAPLNPNAGTPATYRNYPFAPSNDQAAGWNSCVNTSPYDPIAGQQYGVTFPTPTGPRESAGPGSVAQAGGQPTVCEPIRRNNSYYAATLRLDYSLPNDMTATSLTEYQHLDRVSGIDSAGLPFQVDQSAQAGRISSVFQELRLAGKFSDNRGDWIVGANYDYDDTLDRFLGTYAGSSGGVLEFTPSIILPQATIEAINPQQTTTYAVYGGGEYKLLDSLSIVGGLRYTRVNISDQSCLYDAGDGSLAAVAQEISDINEAINGTIPFSTFAAGGGFGVNRGPGACVTNGPGPLYLAYGVAPNQRLDQDNVSWRAGLNWKVVADSLLYVTVSQGYKAGSFSTLPAFDAPQLKPAVQEGLLAYEGGFKSRLFDRQLTLDGAVFYYDYTNKQVSGAVADPVFGALSALVNIPKSHVVGFELSGAWTPNFLPGLTVTPAVSYQASRIDHCSAKDSPNCINGDYYNYGAFARPNGSDYDLNGEPFPDAPDWQASLNAEYDWTLRDGLQAFVGGDATYTSGTDTYFTDPSPQPGENYNPLAVPAYGLLDLRAGVSRDHWRFQLWGHNVTNTYYWTAAYHQTDADVRYTGMPATYGATFSYRY